MKRNAMKHPRAVNEEHDREAGKFFLIFCREVETATGQSRHLRKELGGLTSRVLRGGSWTNNTESNLLSSNRNNNTRDNRNNNNGFRCVLVVGGGGKAAKSGCRSVRQRPNNRCEPGWGGSSARPVPRASLTLPALP